MKNKDPIPESSSYDNYLDKTSRENDVYNNSLQRFFPDEEIEVPFKKKEEPPEKDHVRLMRVNLVDLDAHVEFCKIMGQIIPHEKNDIYFPLESENSIFKDENTVLDFVDENLIKPKYKPKSPKPAIEKEWKKHWIGMPEFTQETKEPYKSVNVKIRTEEDLEKFRELTGCVITDKTKSMHYPKTERSNNLVKRWIGEYEPPRYPFYIISKGRHESMYTSRAFAKMKLHHYIIIEPQDLENYEKALEHFDLKPYVTLVVAPFSNHGDGPGRARNYAWDHSIHLGAERHWVFDDNIKDFYRLHEGNRYRVMTSAIFNAMEDFVDRYTNVMIAGPNYYFFCASTQIYPPYVANTRIYSALLIKNDCRHRWRGRYNEDTDLSLRVLKDGDTTIQFNAFLQGKSGTQLVKGGNTDEFYHKEGETDKKAWRQGVMNSTGTINKSKMLYDMHPDVTTLTWKYGRAHHFVDYSSFARNKLIFKPGIKIERRINNYGMEFTDTYGISE